MKPECHKARILKNAEFILELKTAARMNHLIIIIITNTCSEFHTPFFTMVLNMFCSGVIMTSIKKKFVQYKWKWLHCTFDDSVSWEQRLRRQIVRKQMLLMPSSGIIVIPRERAYENQHHQIDKCTYSTHWFFIVTGSSLICVSAEEFWV